VHGLGGTELTMVRQFFVDGHTPLPDRRVPVGFPIADREVLILDEAGRPVAPGETGEIVLRSRYLALCYWRRPDLTREAFLPDPDDGGLRRYRTGDLGRVTPDGCLTHLGRGDLQVKIRGHRIELPEVELALLELPGVREAVVTAREDHTGELQLVAYVVPDPGAAPGPDALRGGLAEKLPDYMVPSAFIALDALPQTDTGKVDRNALPAPALARPQLVRDFAPPRTHVEAALSGIWVEVLALDRVGIHDDFLALGGDSLLATKVISRVQRLFGADLTLSAFFEAGTIAEMAEVIGDGRSVRPEA
jgi:acyl-coenzyme A synthetase/AMP-(fatty) acid ligase